MPNADVRRDANPMMMPVHAVNMTWAKGDMSPRMTKISPTSAGPAASPSARPKYWMFSVKANPTATIAPYTMPSTGPSNCRRITQKQQQPEPLADLLDDGRLHDEAEEQRPEAIPDAHDRGDELHSEVEEQRDGHGCAAPQRKANASAAFGSGSHRSIQVMPISTMTSGTTARMPATTKAPAPRNASRYTITARATSESTE